MFNSAGRVRALPAELSSAAKWVGALLDCFNCLSLWIAALAALFVSLRPAEWLLTWLALSGAACLLESLAVQSVIIQPVSQIPEGDVNYVLQSEKIGASEYSNPGGKPPHSKARRLATGAGSLAGSGSLALQQFLQDHRSGPMPKTLQFDLPLAWEGQKWGSP